MFPNETPMISRVEAEGSSSKTSRRVGFRVARSVWFVDF